MPTPSADCRRPNANALQTTHSAGLYGDRDSVAANPFEITWSACTGGMSLVMRETSKSLAPTGLVGVPGALVQATI